MIQTEDVDLPRLEAMRERGFTIPRQAAATSTMGNLIAMVDQGELERETVMAFLYAGSYHRFKECLAEVWEDSDLHLHFLIDEAVGLLNEKEFGWLGLYEIAAEALGRQIAEKFGLDTWNVTCVLQEFSADKSLSVHYRGSRERFLEQRRVNCEISKNP